jgi:hypothetical protein
VRYFRGALGFTETLLSPLLKVISSDAAAIVMALVAGSGFGFVAGIEKDKEGNCKEKRFVHLLRFEKRARFECALYYSIY